MDRSLASGYAPCVNPILLSRPFIHQGACTRLSINQVVETLRTVLKRKIQRKSTTPACSLYRPVLPKDGEAASEGRRS